MGNITLSALESINSLNEQRDYLIDELTDFLKLNVSITEKRSLELLDNIFKMNSQIKLEEDSLIFNRLVSRLIK